MEEQEPDDGERGVSVGVVEFDGQKQNDRREGGDEVVGVSQGSEQRNGGEAERSRFPDGVGRRPEDDDDDGEAARTRIASVWGTSYRGR
ncbi:hypothetical protein ACFQL0_04275 [Haloplanus litoreus]|uniref:hypothetical protein n=1 Tax=Haloplanus litoreus TaxID=767515 RepID=UPI0036094EBA